MARVTSTGNYLKKSTPGDLGGAGTVFIRFKPNGWSSGVGSPRTLFGYSNAAINTFLWYLGNGGDNNIYVGWVIAGSSSRVVIADTGIFSDGVWGNHVFDWDDTADLQHLYVDNTLKGTSSTAFTTPTGLTDLTIGTNSPKEDTSIDQHSGQGHIAEFARWDHVLDSTERSTLQSTGNPACLSTGLLHHYKILGNDSPEPDEITADDLTVVGSPTQTTHPTVGSCGGDQTATLPQLAAAGSLYAPTVVPATLTLTLPRIEATESIYSPTVSAGAVTAVLPAISADGAAYAPTVAPATITETLPLISATGELYAPTVVAAGTTAVLPQLAANGAFYSPTIIFDQTLALPQLTAAGALYAPGVVENLAAGIRVTISNAPVLNLTLADASVLTLTASDDLAEG